MILDNPAAVPAPPGGRYSHVARVELGGSTMLFLSGQIAADAEGQLVGGDDMTAQAEHVMGTIGAILRAHGATFNDVINIRTYLTDLARIGEYGAVRRPFFTGMPPTSTTVEVSRLFVPGALLEVEVVAIIEP